MSGIESRIVVATIMKANRIGTLCRTRRKEMLEDQEKEVGKARKRSWESKEQGREVGKLGRQRRD